MRGFYISDPDVPLNLEMSIPTLIVTNISKKHCLGTQGGSGLEGIRNEAPFIPGYALLSLLR